MANLGTLLWNEILFGKLSINFRFCVIPNATIPNATIPNATIPIHWSVF